MATLTGQPIDQSYSGLLKTTDNAGLEATAKAITDGIGGATNQEMSNTATNFVSGTVDFTGATVSGLPTVTAGLVEGTGTDSLQNAVGTASTASGAASIALGKGSTASNSQSMAYGEEALASGISSAAFGQYAEATNSYAIAFGRTSGASGDGAVAFGQQTSAAQDGAVAMGRQVTSDTADTTHVRALKIVAPDGAALGGNGITLLSPDGTAGVVTLLDTDELALDGVAIGGGGAAGLESGTATDSMQSAASLTTTAAAATGAGSIVLGNGSLDGGSTKCVIIGNDIDARVATNNTIAIGQNITGGAFNGDNIAVGKSITFAGRDAIAIGESITSAPDESVIIGRNASSNAKSVAIGKTANASGDKSVSIGFTSTASGDGAVALGDTVTAAIAQTVSVKALEVQTDSTPTAGGIIMSDAGGTDRRININTSGNLQVDSNVVGEAVVQKAARATLAGPSSADTLVSTITIPAGTYVAGDIIKVWYMMSGDYTGGGTIYFNTLLSNGNTLSNGTFQYGLGSNGSTSAGFIGNKHLVIHTSDGTGNGTSSGSVDGMQDIDAISGAFNFPDNIAKGVDWTTDQYIHLYGFVDNAGSSLTVQGGYVKKEA